MNRLKYHLPRAMELVRLQKQGWQIVSFKTAPVVVAWHQYQRQERSGFEAKAWIFKADKPAFFYTFRTRETMEKYVNDFVTSTASSHAWRIERDKTKAAKRQNLKADTYWSVGDVVYNSWGYDQTNIDWYQVVEVKAKSIVIRAIKRNYAETQFLAGHCQPRRNEFCGEPILKKLDENGGVPFEFGCATKWDGKQVYESHYA